MDVCLSMGYTTALFAAVFSSLEFNVLSELFLTPGRSSFTLPASYDAGKFLVQSHEQMEEFPDILQSFPNFVRQLKA